MTTKAKREYISLGMLYHHPRNYCHEIRDLGCRVIVQHEGEDLAALVPMAELRLLERLIREEEDRVDIAAAEAARAESDERIPLGDMMAKLGLNATLIDGETA